MKNAPRMSGHFASEGSSFLARVDEGGELVLALRQHDVDVCMVAPANARAVVCDAVASRVEHVRDGEFMSHHRQLEKCHWGQIVNRHFEVLEDGDEVLASNETR